MNTRQDQIIDSMRRISGILNKIADQQLEPDEHIWLFALQNGEFVGGIACKTTQVMLEHAATLRDLNKQPIYAYDLIDLGRATLVAPYFERDPNTDPIGVRQV